MKLVINLLMVLLFNVYSFSQENTGTLKENKNNSSFISNNTLVFEYLNEYMAEAHSHNINYDKGFKDLKYILIEIGLKNPKDRELSWFNLGKIDKDRNLILLSRDCLLDRNILKATLFRVQKTGIVYHPQRIKVSIDKLSLTICKIIV